MVKNRLLVVEDDLNQGYLYEQELEDDGYEVVVAHTGREALEMFNRDSFDLVILDIGLPEMDGLETLGRLLGIDNTIPVILNTAYPSYKDNFMSWAADAYVVKSSDLSELKEKIKESVSRRTV